MTLFTGYRFLFLLLLSLGLNTLCAAQSSVEYHETDPAFTDGEIMAHCTSIVQSKEASSTNASDNCEELLESKKEKTDSQKKKLEATPLQQQTNKPSDEIQRLLRKNTDLKESGIEDSQDVFGNISDALSRTKINENDLQIEPENTTARSDKSASDNIPPDSTITSNESPKKNISGSEETEPSSHETGITSKNQIDDIQTQSSLPNDIIIRAAISYKGFTKPVTTCRAQVVNVSKGSKGSLFNVEGDVQTSDIDVWPQGTALDDTILISFSNALPYGSAACKRHDITSKTYTVSSFLSEIENQDYVINIEPGNTIFVAYINLQSEKVYRSVARWRETLEAANAIYKTGLSSKKWTDGVILGLDETGAISPIFIPQGNYPSEILTKSNILDLASNMSTQPRTSSKQENTIKTVKDQFVSNKSHTLYISDQYPSCRSAMKSIAGANFDKEQEIFFVLPVSETSKKTGALTLPDSNKILSCNSDNLQNHNDSIIAFDLFERASNLDWKHAMKQAEKQAEKVEFSREKF